MKFFILLFFMFSINISAESFREKIRSKLAEKLAEREMKKSAPEASSIVNSLITKPGSFIFTIKVDSIDRYYKVYIPTKFNFQTSSPVIFAFHGGGGDMNQMSEEKNYNLISKSEELAIPIVFANGYSVFPTGRIATWNAGKCCGDARDKKIDDIKLVREVFNSVKNQLKINESEVYAIGMSNGGMISYRLACEAPDIFKKIMAVAGTDNTDNCIPKKPISIFHVHAIDDDHVLFNGGHGKAFTDKRIEKITEFSSVKFTIEKWLKNNKCSEKKVRVLDNKDVYCDLYNECAEGTKVKLCATTTGGHSWPGSSKNKSSAAISANKLMWEFFKENK